MKIVHDSHEDGVDFDEDGNNLMGKGKYKIVDFDTGEIVGDYKPKEADKETFVLCYPQSIGRVDMQIMRYMNNENRVYLDRERRKAISVTLSCSVGHVSNEITSMIKNNVLLRVGKGEYMVNPYLYTKGSRRNLGKMREAYMRIRNRMLEEGGAIQKRGAKMYKLREVR